MFQLYVSWAQ